MKMRSVKINTEHDTKMSRAIGGFLGYMNKNTNAGKVTVFGKRKR